MSELRAFIAMLTRAGIGHGLRTDRPSSTVVLVENEDDNCMITEFAFDEAGALISVHCYLGDDG